MVVTKETRFGRGRKRGFAKTLVSLEPGQIDVLREEAARRALARKAGRMDTGEVMRDAVDQWARAREAVGAAHGAIEEWIDGARRWEKDGDAGMALVYLTAAEKTVKMLADLLGESPASARFLGLINASRAAIAEKAPPPRGRGKR